MAVSSACPGRHALDRKRGLVLLCRPPARRPDGGTLRVLLRQTIVPSEIKSAPVSCSRRPLKNNVNNTEKKKKKNTGRFLKKGFTVAALTILYCSTPPFADFFIFSRDSNRLLPRDRTSRPTRFSRNGTRFSFFFLPREI